MNSFSHHNIGVRSDEQRRSSSSIKVTRDASTVAERNELKNVLNLSNSSNDSFASLSCAANPVYTSSATQFMDTLSLSSSSTLSDIRDYEDDDISHFEGNRASFFIESSRVSVSSDEGDPLPSLLEFILSEHPQDVPLDVAEALYNDWDSGLSHSSIELNRDDTENWANNSADRPVLDVGLDYPHRALRYMECQICFEMAYLRRRVCCDFQICGQCISMYLAGKVQCGKVQIECPNDRCNAPMHREEIRHRLSVEMREKYTKFLVDANKDPHIKTCPSCSLPFAIDPAKLKISKKKLKQGVEVTCTQCRLVWCFRCQAPFHSNLTCKKYKNEDEMVKRWAKERCLNGLSNAQRCPKCKIFVQKTEGCNHMKCTQCETNFCYRCGDRYISVKFFGSHWNRFSVFGCKYRLMPEKTGLRRLIRGSHFVGRVLAAITIASLGVAAGAVLVAGSVVILPGYGIVRLRRRMWAAKQRKKFYREKMRMIRIAEIQKSLVQFGANLETVVEESETEMSEPAPDPQQVQVMVHHPEVRDEPLTVEGDMFVNKYAGDDSELTTSLPVSGQKSLSADNSNAVTDFKNVPTEMEGDEAVEKVVDNNDEAFDVGDENLKMDHVYKQPDDVNTYKRCNEIMEGRERKLSNPELSPCGGVLLSENEIVAPNSTKKKEDGIENVEVKSYSSDLDYNDPQIKRSLSKEKCYHEEKIIRTKTLKDEGRNFIPQKLDTSETKGCFGNIFCLRSSGVMTVHRSNEDNDKCDKPVNNQKTSRLPVRKAATWEKCRRSKVEVNPLVKTSVDSMSDGNHLPLIVHKSQSSFSSIIGFNFRGDELDKVKDHDAYDCPNQEEIICDVQDDKKTVKNESDTRSTDTSDTRNTDTDAKDDTVHRVELEISDVEDIQKTPHEHGYISQVSAVTHL